MRLTPGTVQGPPAPFRPLMLHFIPFQSGVVVRQVDMCCTPCHEGAS